MNIFNIYLEKMSSKPFPQVQIQKILTEKSKIFGTHSTSKKVKLLKTGLPKEKLFTEIEKQFKGNTVKKIKLIDVSKNPDSSKFAAIEFDIDGNSYRITLADDTVYKNQGNEYETILVSEINNAILNQKVEAGSDLDIILKESKIKISQLKEAVQVGGNDTRRGTDNLEIENVGSTLSDVDLVLKNGKRLHLSLKMGTTVNFLSGKKVSYLILQDKEVKFNESIFKASKERNDVLLKLLKIDFNKVAQGLTEYYQNNILDDDDDDEPTDTISKDYVDIKVTPTIKNSFEQFIASTYGYGYYYIHKEKNKIKCISLNTKEDAKSAAGEIKSIKIKYPNIQNKAVTINVVTDGELFGGVVYQLTLRNTQGKLLPMIVQGSKRVLKKGVLTP